MRRIITTLSGLAAAAITLIMTASAASAHLLAPPDGGVTGPTTRVVHHHAGLVGWQIALILVTAFLFIGLTGTVVARRVRTGSHRPAIS
jgi:hypothetical protein